MKIEKQGEGFVVQVSSEELWDMYSCAGNVILERYRDELDNKFRNELAKLIPEDQKEHGLLSVFHCR